MSRTRIKYLYRVVDQRAGNCEFPLMTVSIHHGVVQRDALTDDLPRSEDLSNYKICRSGDIVLNRMRAFQGAIGISLRDGLVSPDYLVLRPNPDTSPQYLHYLFRSTCFVGEMTSRLRGIGNAENGSVRTPRINPEDLGEIIVDFPDLDDQRCISDFLDAETGRIGALERLRRRQRALLEMHCRNAISEILTPGISSDTHRCQYWPWLPASIVTYRLGYAARIQSGVTVHAGRENKEDEAEYPYLRVANVQGGEVDLSEIKTITISSSMARRSMLLPGDVVMTEANGNPDNLGRGAVWRGEIPEIIHQNHVFAIRTDPNKLLPEYLSMLLTSVHGRWYFSSTSTQVGIATTSSSKVLNFPVPMLPLKEQVAAVERCQKVTCSTKDAIDTLDRQLVLLAECKQALITAAVTGAIEVTTARGLD